MAVMSARVRESPGLCDVERSKQYRFPMREVGDTIYAAGAQRQHHRGPRLPICDFLSWLSTTA
jgi:hypothetical protein